MLRYLVNPANAITMFGLLRSSIALCLALDRRLGLAVAAGRGRSSPTTSSA